MPYKDPKIRKAKHRDYSKKWYVANKDLVLERNRSRKKGYRKDWFKYKSSKHCAKCGASHPAILDFHHVIRENKQSIPKLIRQGRYAAAIKEAETKCMPLCANCHRLLHWNEHRRNKRWAIYKKPLKKSCRLLKGLQKKLIPTMWIGKERS